MANPSNYRRPAFQHRPWITGKLYDTYALPSILHLDAYVMQSGTLKYLELWWSEGGHKIMAHDLYMIESDGLTPIWQAPDNAHALHWTRENNAWMARVHKTVLAQEGRMLALGQGRWARVVTQCHYVLVRDTNAEPARNKYTAPKEYVPRAGTSDDLAAQFAEKPPKRRGRPPKDPFKGITL